MAERVSWGERAYAGFWRRFVGWLIDGFVLGAVGGGLAAAFAPAVLTEPIDPLALELPAGFAADAAGWSVVGVVLFVAYETVMLSTLGWTLGKKAVGVEVRGADGGLLSAPRAMGRVLGKYVSALPLLLGFLWAAFDRRKQAWHDKFVSSFVLKRAALRPVGGYSLSARLGAPSASRTVSVRPQGAPPAWGIQTQGSDAGTAGPAAPPDAASAPPDAARGPGDVEPAAPEPQAEEPATPEEQAAVQAGTSEAEGARPGAGPPAAPPDAAADRSWADELSPEPEDAPPAPEGAAPETARMEEPQVEERREPDVDVSPPESERSEVERSVAERSPEPGPAPTPAPGPPQQAAGERRGWPRPPADDANLVAVARAGLGPEAESWLQQVAGQVDARLDRVSPPWRSSPHADAARACAFGLLTGYLARLYPHMQSDLSRVAEGHPSFSTLGSGNRLQTLQEIAGDPGRATAWLGPLIGTDRPEDLRRLFE